MVEFIVDGEERELHYNVNGVDIGGDFIGNTSHGMDTDDEGRYIATQEDFEWWQGTIAAYENLDATIAAYKEEFDADAVTQVVEDWSGGDYDTEPQQIILGLAQAFGELQSETAKREAEIARAIKNLDEIFWADRQAREAAAAKIEGPFSSGMFVYNDQSTAVELAISAYKEALNALNTVGGDERNSENGQHYTRMIALLSD